MKINRYQKRVMKARSPMEIGHPTSPRATIMGSADRIHASWSVAVWDLGLFVGKREVAR